MEDNSHLTSRFCEIELSPNPISKRFKIVPANKQFNLANSKATILRVFMVDCKNASVERYPGRLLLCFSETKFYSYLFFFPSGFWGIQIGYRHSLPHCVSHRLVSVQKLHWKTKTSATWHHLHANCLVSSQIQWSWHRAFSVKFNCSYVITFMIHDIMMSEFFSWFGIVEWYHIKLILLVENA